MPETQNASRRFIFETTHRVEVPINEDKLKEYLGHDNLDEINEEIMLRGLEESIYSGDSNVRIMGEALTADPEFNQLGDYDIIIEVEVRCEKHECWYPSNLECVYCRSPELWAHVIQSRKQARMATGDV